METKGFFSIYLCYGSTAIINMCNSFSAGTVFISLSDVYSSQILSYEYCPCAERVKYLLTCCLFFFQLERLWIDLLSSLQSRYSGEYDTELLTDMSPLLAAAFMHSRRAIKSHTSMFWMATFARTSTLEYTDNLKLVFTNIKKNVLLIE